jgi:hypothetical protein
MTPVISTEAFASSERGAERPAVWTTTNSVISTAAADIAVILSEAR